MYITAAWKGNEFLITECVQAELTEQLVSTKRSQTSTVGPWASHPLFRCLVTDLALSTYSVADHADPGVHETDGVPALEELTVYSL